MAGYRETFGCIGTTIYCLVIFVFIFGVLFVFSFIWSPSAMQEKWEPIASLFPEREAEEGETLKKIYFEEEVLEDGTVEPAGMYVPATDRVDGLNLVMAMFCIIIGGFLVLSAIMTGPFWLYVPFYIIPSYGILGLSLWLLNLVKSETILSFVPFVVYVIVCCVLAWGRALAFGSNSYVNSLRSYDQ